MTDSIRYRPTLRRGVGFTALLLTGLLGAAGAQAGACPDDQRRPDARPVSTEPARGVTDTVIAAIDVAREPAAIRGRQFRMRRLVIEPGGTVPWHSHGDRPALIYIVEGTIVEYASNCAVPITHGAGDVAAETHATSHWWRNHSDRPVVLISADLLHDPNDHNM